MTLCFNPKISLGLLKQIYPKFYNGGGSEGGSRNFPKGAEPGSLWDRSPQEGPGTKTQKLKQSVKFVHKFLRFL